MSLIILFENERTLFFQTGVKFRNAYLTRITIISRFVCLEHKTT